MTSGHNEDIHVLSCAIASMQITCAEKCLGMLSLVYQDEDVMNNADRSPKLRAGVHTRVEDKLNAGPEATG